MDIYEYFNSPDVAAYCKSIDKTFDPLEMAVILYHCRAGLKKRTAGFKALLNETEDILVHATLLNDELPSLHACIKKQLAAEEKIRAFFLASEPGAVYYCECDEYRSAYSSDPPHHKDGPFSTFEKALAALNDVYENSDQYGSFYCFSIEKSVLDDNRCAGFIVSLSGDLLHSTGDCGVLDEEESESIRLLITSISISPRRSKRGISWSLQIIADAMASMC